MSGPIGPSFGAFPTIGSLPTSGLWSRPTSGLQAVFERQLGTDTLDELPPRALHDHGVSDAIERFRTYGERILENFEGLRQSFEERRERLEARMDGIAERLQARTDGIAERLEARMDGIAERLEARMDDLAERIGELPETAGSGMTRVTVERIDGEVVSVTVEGDGHTVVKTSDDGSLFVAAFVVSHGDRILASLAQMRAEDA